MLAARTRWFRTSSLDGALVVASVVHGVLLFAVMAAQPGPAALHALAIVILGAAMNWSSNTVSHIHLHTPLFRRDGANRMFSLYLSVLLAVPQGWWKARHLEHHELPEARVPAALRRQGLSELTAMVLVWGAMLWLSPLAFATIYVPAMLLGLGLCAIQGREEHARSAAGVDVHAPLYNRLWFNDGFHAAHHRRPDAHWTTLPAATVAGDVVSPWPPTLRWLERAPVFANGAVAASIDWLEGVTVRLPVVRWFLLATHQRAWTRLLAEVDAGTIRAVTIVGGGLFPRTALILARLLPGARLTIVEAVPAHVARAQRFLSGDVDATFVVGRLGDDLATWRAAVAADLLVLPLAFRGDRGRYYRRPPVRLVAIHDWLWRGQGTRGVRISFALLKRLNLVQGQSQVDAVQVHATCGGGAPQPPSAAGTNWML